MRAVGDVVLRATIVGAEQDPFPANHVDSRADFVLVGGLGVGVVASLP